MRDVAAIEQDIGTFAQSLTPSPYAPSIRNQSVEIEPCGAKFHLAVTAVAEDVHGAYIMALRQYV